MGAFEGIWSGITSGCINFYNQTINASKKQIASIVSHKAIPLPSVEGKNGLLFTRRGSFCSVNQPLVCMYLMIRKGQIGQKNHMGAKMYASSCHLKTSCPGTDATASGNRFQYLTTLHAKLLLLLRVLLVCWRSLNDDLLSPGLLENLNNWVASR